jgi:hypothetical protein
MKPEPKSRPDQSNQPPHAEQMKAVAQVAEAHSLLTALRKELDQHPELEEAIRKLEMALSVLTLESGGML